MYSIKISSIMKYSTATIAIFLASAGGASAVTYLGPSAYLQASDSPFSGGSFAYFHLEDFEDNALNSPLTKSVLDELGEV